MVKLDLTKEGLKGIASPFTCERFGPIPSKEKIGDNQVKIEPDLIKKDLGIVKTSPLIHYSNPKRARYASVEMMPKCLFVLKGNICSKGDEET